ncbi:hypothetical protein F2P56_022595 [Juglans regia]|uniref:BTB domain-containing protein n=2 Tax=Juglans regia TaxID=51240 RepID=A0A833X3F4_JUGRE|nr:BTB/POZ and MATH domain-containing protein 4-like [Juglans regia]KAF5458574.1 hypothetical protein F2P56_022595 [Juglans regia]
MEKVKVVVEVDDERELQISMGRVSEHETHHYYDDSADVGGFSDTHPFNRKSSVIIIGRGMAENTVARALQDVSFQVSCWNHGIGLVVVFVQITPLIVQESIHVPESDIGAPFGMLLEKEECSDITFNVSGKRFHAHKLVLAARSHVFETGLFLYGMDGNNPEIVIADMEPRVLMALLHYIYRDTHDEDEDFLALTLSCT